MKLKILAIGDTANNAYVLSKYVKKSTIHIINFPRIGAAAHTYTENVEFFDSFKITDQVKKINSIKDEFDLCFISSWEGARVAFLADLNYIMYFVGGDVKTAPFIKNAKVPYLKEPIHKKNVIERVFLKKVLDNAITCVTYGGKSYLRELKKFRNDVIRMDQVAVDTDTFNTSVSPISRKKTKFTFLSPQRQGLEKGMDVIWKALPLCKTDFEVLQVDWFDERNNEEKQILKKFLENKPQQIKLIPLIKREEMPGYYAFSDAVLGQMRIRNGGIEREAVFCGKPVVHFSDPNESYLINGEEISAPFQPNSNDPKKVAEVIDKVVKDEEYRHQLYEKELKFVKALSDPKIVASEWDKLFERFHNECGSIRKNSSKINIKILNLFAKLMEDLVYKRKWKKTKLSSITNEKNK